LSCIKDYFMSNIQTELLKRINEMSEDEKRQLLQFANNLPAVSPQKAPMHFLDLVGTLDDQSAKEMMQVIEKDCERIDPDEWCISFRYECNDCHVKREYGPARINR
jgi:hypothetical protein